LQILIAILSCHKYADLRQAQRETFLSDCTVDYRYFIGEPEGVEPDAVYLGVPDSYDHLTLKTQAMCRWALDNGYTHLFKCDDDTFIHVDRLLTSGFEQHKYSGYTTGRTWAQGGAGYWLNRECMELVANSCYKPPQHPAEDVMVGGTLKAVHIYPVHDERYRTGYGVTNCQVPTPNNDVITAHKLNAHGIRTVHSGLLSSAVRIS
jgi:hypothetical protein